MKEFIEKLIGRLEERIFSAELYNDEFDGQTVDNLICLGDVTDTVNQLAEEYKEKVIINGQYCWQTCGATEHCKECNRLCNGSIDYYENYDLLEEKYNNDFCEWKFIKSVADGGYFYSSGCNHKRFSDLHSFEYCPYCGKKIKVVEPKRE